jgi:NOL1/NOP2/fmu family ribosome biogenesis protein
MLEKYQKNKIAFSSIWRLLPLTICFLVLFTNVSFASASSVQKKQSDSSVPVIHPRSAWSNSKYEKRTKKVWPAEYKDPEVIIIHHTATNYKSSASKQIRKIYKYHSYTKKWGDIGYNYVIGEDGTIFQGRYGNNGVIGGHAYNSVEKINYNSGSIGIAVLGNYDNKKLPSAAQDSLEKLVGWLAANNDISIKSGIKFHGKSLSDSVVGHRNVASTACPGKNINSLMSSIRSSAENSATVYGNYAYKISGENESYEITGGERYAGSEKQPVIEISATQMNAYSLAGENSDGGDEAALPAYPSGTLFRNQSNGSLALLENGLLRLIGSDVILKTSFKNSNAVEIDENKWNEYAAGEAAGFRSGSFLKNGENYYFISGSQKRKCVFSQDQLAQIDLDSAQEVDESQIEPYTDGADITSVSDIPSGTILTTNFKTFYYIESAGIKKKMTKSVFRAGFSNTAAVKVSRQLLKSYKTSGNLPFQNGSLVKYNGKYYFIEKGKKRMFRKKSLISAMGFSAPAKAKRKDMVGIVSGQIIE